MRYAASAKEVNLNDARSGYTMCFPIDGACASMQSNMAATLNIDWLLDIAREAAEMAGIKTRRQALSPVLTQGPRRRARSGNLSSLHP